MLTRILLAIFVLSVLSACQQGVDPADLTEDENRNLEFVDQENVAMYGAPPMIPAGHDFVLGEDIAQYANGGQDCLDCHNDESEEEATQTTHPDRHNCLQCHVPQLNEDSLPDDFVVENDFRKVNPGAGK